MPLPDPNPANPGMTQSLSSISADSATDIWAVGMYTIVYAPTGIRYEPYSLHWNGSTWAVVAMPPVPGSDGHLVYQFHAIDAISPTNVWAVGQSGDDVSGLLWRFLAGDELVAALVARGGVMHGDLAGRAGHCRYRPKAQAI